MQAFSAEQFVQISNVTLAADVPMGVDVFLRSQADARPELFCAATQLPDRAELRNLARRNEADLCVRVESHDKYREYLRGNAAKLLRGNCHAPQLRLRLLGEVVREIMREEFRAEDTPRAIQVASECGRSIVTVLDEHPYLGREIHEGLQHDGQLHTHSTNVAIYCVILAGKLGYSATQQHEIASGALLHDIGQSSVDDNLLNKPGGLTKKQYREIKRHPIIGLATLAQSDRLKYPQLMMVYQHHERLDGSGYPSQVCGDEIHAWAKLCAIADAYEALVSFRPYRAAATPAEAAEDLQACRGTAFDPEMLDCWTRFICNHQ